MTPMASPIVQLGVKEEFGIDPTAALFLFGKNAKREKRMTPESGQHITSLATLFQNAQKGRALVTMRALEKRNERLCEAYSIALQLVLALDGQQATLDTITEKSLTAIAGDKAQPIDKRLEGLRLWAERMAAGDSLDQESLNALGFIFAALEKILVERWRKKYGFNGKTQQP